jgi:glycosyltransferase involved in cell wall biosynthesis
MALEILSMTADLDHYGGAQKVLMDVHEGIKDKYSAKVIGFVKFADLHSKYKIAESEYVRFTNPFYLNNKILIVHARNVMAFIMVLKRMFFLNTKILYIHHNVYSTLKWASFFPNDIISISEKVTNNLHNYFNLRERNIQLIYNGIKDGSITQNISSLPLQGKIKILYSARINNVKRQLEIVERLKYKLSPAIEIHFVGIGPDYLELAAKCNESNNFYALGFIENTNEIIVKYDYLMLYSKQEGLPIALIEGAMHAKPLLVNDVGGNTEIGVPGVNGILLNDDWDKLAATLNNLANLPGEEYVKMKVNSRNRYEQMFTYEKMIASYHNKIKQMIEN